MRSSLRPGPRRLFLAVAACAVLWQASPARAQIFQTSGEGLNTGRFVLYPSITLEYTDDDNVFYVNENRQGADVVSSGVYVVKPRIMVDLPMGQNRLRWVYAPTYRDYTTESFQSTNRLSHFFDLEGTIRVGPALGVLVRDHFVRGMIELQEIDPGGEVTFGLTPFITHSAEMDVTLDLGSRTGVSLIPRYLSARFDDLEAAPFFGYRRRDLEARINYRLSEPTTVYLYHIIERTDQDRERENLGEVDQDAGVIGIGLRRTINEVVTTQFVAGHRTMRFQGGLGKDFSGPVLDASAAWHLTDATRVSVSAGRETFPSVFVNNNYYVNSEMRLRLTQQVGQRLYWDATVSYGASDYPDPVDGSLEGFTSFQPSDGRRRRDRNGRVEIGAGYRILRSMRVFGGYSLVRRDSNIEQCELADGVCTPGSNFEPFDYRVNRLFIRLEAGWF